VSFEDRQDLLGRKGGRVTTHYSSAELANLIEATNTVCTVESRNHMASTKKRLALSCEPPDSLKANGAPGEIVAIHPWTQRIAPALLSKIAPSNFVELPILGFQYRDREFSIFRAGPSNKKGPTHGGAFFA
jgi:hypothetical protein